MAGLESVEIGLESGSPKVLKAIKKNIILDQVESFCEEASRLGIKVFVFCMISLPDETLDDVDMTIKFIRNIKSHISNAGMQATRILPDAALYQMAKDRGVLLKEFSWFSHYQRSSRGESNPIYDTLPLYMEHLSVDDIRRKRAEFKNALSSVVRIYNDIKMSISMKNVVSAKKYMTLVSRLKWAMINACQGRGDTH